MVVALTDVVRSNASVSTPPSTDAWTLLLGVKVKRSRAYPLAVLTFSESAAVAAVALESTSNSAASNGRTRRAGKSFSILRPLSAERP